MLWVPHPVRNTEKWDQGHGAPAVQVTTLSDVVTLVRQDADQMLQLNAVAFSWRVRWQEQEDWQQQVTIDSDTTATLERDNANVLRLCEQEPQEKEAMRAHMVMERDALLQNAETQRQETQLTPMMRYKMFLSICLITKRRTDNLSYYDVL